jgi:small-conductance mechanosensitive channel
MHGHATFRRLACLVALLAVALLAAASGAQPLPGLSPGEPASPAAEPAPREAIAGRLAALAQELERVEREIARAPEGPARAHAVEAREALRRIESLLRKQQDLVAEAPRSSQDPAGGERELPPSVFALNRLYELRADAEEQRERSAESLEVAREALVEAREQLEQAERRRREARAELEAAADAEARAQAERQLELRRLASRRAQERVELRSLEARLAKRAQDSAPEAATLEERIERMRDELSRGADDADAGLQTLAEREAQLRRARPELERRLATAEVRLEAAQQRYSQQAEPPPELLEEVEARSAQRDALREEIELIDAQLERLEERRALLRRWSQVLRGEGARGELTAWKQSADERLDAFRRAELQRQGRVADLERRLETLRARLADLPRDARLRPALEAQRASLADLLDAERSAVAELARDRRLAERLLADLRDRTGDIDLLGSIANAWRETREVWTYELTAVEDSPITVGSVVLALLFAGVGLWVSRRGSLVIEGVATRRLKLDAGAAHALQRLSFYVLVVSFTLLALRAVHFPLTAFTVLGGALAIGVGFGSQNVMNNFISGLILMLERPVRAGDLVEVDTNHGTIMRIGGRSTQIRSTDGRYIVVPNSFFLENNVVNWTLSDDLIRTSVSVGVIYGSPTRLVEQLIKQVVDEEEAVIREPEPVILFSEFGDNSLNFEVHFWVRARSPMQMRRTQSRMRFRIDDLFREHDLVIAFPQRDVHLDTVSPLEVRVVTGAGPEPERGDG